MRLRRNQRSPIELASGVVSARYFCIMEENKQEEFQYLGGFEGCGPSYDLQRNNFPYLTLEIIVGGKGKLTLNEKEFGLEAGFCFCTGPGVNFRIQSDRRDPLGKYFIVFGNEIQPRKTHPRSLHPGYLVEGRDVASLTKWSELILEEGTSQTRDASANLVSLIHILERAIGDSKEGIYHKPSQGALVTKALRRIDRQFHSLQTIQELADELNITPEHLCRAFRKSGKASPYKILMRRKLEHAYTQLKLSSIPIQDIALSLGFADAFQFSRTFKKHYGRPPSVVRSE